MMATISGSPLSPRGQMIAGAANAEPDWQRVLHRSGRRPARSGRDGMPTNAPPRCTNVEQEVELRQKCIVVLQPKPNSGNASMEEPRPTIISRGPVKADRAVEVLKRTGVSRLAQ
ncbi:MAG: hypothetical protein Udaeo2_21390 [Candidatus Udaeobacter sp.]|nr:MAG: hypothetical protein Udaeo2_21390 [Candidatus Udaeobacter sp.]